MIYAQQVSPIMSRGAWENQRVLITGGTGFLGRYLTRQLADLGALVTVALCEEDGPQQLADLPDEVKCGDGDVRDYDQMWRLAAATTPNYVYHLAAVGVNDPFVAEETALQVNLHGTLNLLRAVQRVSNAGEQPVRRIIVAGTSYEYGKSRELDPGNVYAASKVAAWAFCRMYYRAHGMPVVIARPFNVYGPGQNQRALIPSAIRAALSDQDFPTTPGEQRRDFIHVNDVVRGFLVLAMAIGIEGESFDLGTGKTTSIRDVVKRIYALTESAGQARIGALRYRPGVVWEQIADAERTRQFTGWHAEIGLDEGLYATIQAMCERAQG